MADRSLFRGSRRGPSKRVILNRRTLTALGEGIADGLGQFGQSVIDRARPTVPDAPPFGLGLVNTGGWAVYVNAKKVGGQATAPRSRRSANKPPAQGTVLYVGYGFPAHFAELGTVHETARPFLTPAINAETPNLPNVVRPKVRDRLRGIH